MTTDAGPPFAPARPPQRPVPWVAYAAGFLVLALLSALVTHLVFNRDSTSGAPAVTGPVTSDGSADTAGTVPAVTDGGSVAPVTDAPLVSEPSVTADTTPGTPAPPPDPLAQLEATRAADAPAVEALVGSWVPQLSGKRPGIEDDGIVFDLAAIVDYHGDLVERYRALLLFSADYVIASDDLWVSIAPLPSSTPDGALQFCIDEGFDRDHCFARLITHDASLTPTAKLLPA